MLINKTGAFIYTHYFLLSVEVKLNYTIRDSMTNKGMYSTKHLVL